MPDKWFAIMILGCVIAFASCTATGIAVDRKAGHKDLKVCVENGGSWTDIGDGRNVVMGCLND